MKTSRAATVYDLLSEVARLVDAEPKRLRMDTWLLRRASKYMDPDKVPPCDTVGCVGGWMEALTGLDPSSWYKQFGLTRESAVRLFHDQALVHDPYQGTRAHARRVIAHIRRFQKQHAKVLRATKVPGW